MKHNIKKTVFIHNKFEIYREKNGKEELLARAFNLITNGWFNTINTNNQQIFNKIAYGSGSGTPAITDTALFTEIGTTVATSVAFDKSKAWTDGYYSLQKKVTLAPGVNTGETFTEVGIKAADNTLCTHAMLEDMNGNPLSITKGADDNLIIYATVYCYLDLTGYETENVRFRSNTIKSDAGPQSGAGLGLIGFFLGEIHRGEIRGDNAVGYYASTVPMMLGPRYLKNASYFPSYIGAKGSITTTWDNTNRKFVYTMPQVDSADLNPGSAFNNSVLGICIFDGNDYWGGLEIAVDLPTTGLGGTGAGEDRIGYVPISHLKNAGAVGTGDGATLDFKTPFSFIKDDSSFVLYADGVAIPGANYSVDFGKPPTNNMVHYFKRLEGTYPLFGFKYSNYEAPSLGDYEISENVFYNDYSITEFKVAYTSAGGSQALKVSTSDDLSIWTDFTIPITIAPSTVSVPAGQQGARYWKAEIIADGANPGAYDMLATGLTDLTNIHFTAGNAPANGAVLTHDARYLCLPKNSDIYVNMTMDLELRRYSEI